jgi:hypothetical protein
MLLAALGFVLGSLTWYAYIPETVEAERREGAKVVFDYFLGHDPSS